MSNQSIETELRALLEDLNLDLRLSQNRDQHIRATQRIVHVEQILELLSAN